jgi:cob(I)alamin adenosyltransferase
MTIRIDSVVTKGGDGGETSLGDGTRVAKDALRVEAYGTVDEANAAIGVLRLHVGSDLCVPGKAGARLRVTDAPTLRLEAEVAAMTAILPPLTSFILPGGTAAATFAHVARTVVRRAERRVVSLSHAEEVNPAVIRLLNRLSDHLFVLGRILNDGGKADIQWVPGANR